MKYEIVMCYGEVENVGSEMRIFDIVHRGRQYGEFNESLFCTVIETIYASE